MTASSNTEKNMHNFNNLITDVVSARYKQANEISKKIKNIESDLNKGKIYKEFSFNIDTSLILKWTKKFDDPIRFRLTLLSEEIKERPLIEHPLDIRENITEEILSNFLIAFKDYIKK